jgi:hypothetical protein
VTADVEGQEEAIRNRGRERHESVQAAANLGGHDHTCRRDRRCLGGFRDDRPAFEVEGFSATLGVILLGAPLALFLATWPLALRQMMRALADGGDAVSR